MLQNRLLRRRIAVSIVFGLALLVAPRLEAGSEYKVLHAFTGKPDGGGVYAGLAIDGDGNLYGATRAGGVYGYGTVFELTLGPNGKWTEVILHSFCANFPHCADGDLPMRSPLLGPLGNVYGNSDIAIFRLKPEPASGWSFQVIYDSGSDGLVMDTSGNLYGGWGPGKYDAGDIFELSPGADGWTENVLYSFTGKNGDCCPSSALTFDAAGNLYGTTQYGGIGFGTAYRIVKGKDGIWREQRLHNFSGGSDGRYPWNAGLVLDREGNIYGTTLQGGGCGGGCGTVFKLTPTSDGHWKETTLYNFNNDKYGSDPAAALTFDKAGNLYGTTSAGGLGNGVVFKMTPQANGKWKYTVLHRFNGKDGYSPQASVILDDKGNIYGTTTEGGPGGYGVVFEITP